MDFELLAERLFPHISITPEEFEASLPRRILPPEAKVTRFAPSPTGFVHFGGLFPAVVSERLAHQSGGIFYLRIEDTDAKREVLGAAQGLIETLALSLRLEPDIVIVAPLFSALTLTFTFALSQQFCNTISVFDVVSVISMEWLLTELFG